MTKHTDIAVIGLGIAGSAIAARLSEGRKVVGIDRFTPPHIHGSSHGENRIIRGAPGEGAVYGQLAARAFALFADLERRTGRTLLYRTGGIDASLVPSIWAYDVRILCGQLGLESESMPGSAFNRRFGNFALPVLAEVVLQTAFGHLDAERTWLSFLDVARDNGADLQFGAEVAHIAFGDPCRIHFRDGEVLEAGQLVLAAGSWLPQLLDVPLKLRVERRVMAWYPLERRYGPLLPFCYADGKGAFWYGMPTLDGTGLKIGEHHHFKEIVDPGAVPPVNDRDLALLHGFIASHTRGIRPEPYRTATCKYTLTGNGDFLIDRHARHANVLIFSCCSGHGFKYAPVYGEIAAALLEGETYPIGLEPFGLAQHVAA